MNKDMIQRLLASGRRRHVVAAAKLGCRAARKELNISTPKRRMSSEGITSILCEAGYPEDVAEVMIPMALLRIMLPIYFEMFEEQAHTDFSSAAINVMSSIELWLKDPCPEAATQVFAQGLNLHRSLLARSEVSDLSNNDDEEDASTADEDDAAFDDFDEVRDPPEDLLYAALRGVTRLTSPIERSLDPVDRPSVQGCLSAITQLQRVMRPACDRDRDGNDSRAAQRLLSSTQEILAREILKAD